MQELRSVISQVGFFETKARKLAIVLYGEIVDKFAPWREVCVGGGASGLVGNHAEKENHKNNLNA